ncbi:MAG: hypothetical protein ACE5MI_03625 [Acidimicrobiia bacterium]
MRFAGQLLVPNDPAAELRVVLEISGERVVVTAGAKELGSWPLAEVALAALDDGRFSLVVDEDTTHFVPDDPVRFSYDASPVLGSSETTGTLGRLWTWLTAPQPLDPEPGPAAAPHSTTTLTRERVPSPVDLTIDLSDKDAEKVPYDVFKDFKEDLPVPPPEAEPAEAVRCRGRRQDGMPCRSQILGKTGFCAAHDPQRPPRRPRRRPRRLSRLYRHLDHLIERVEAGEVDPEIALAVSSLVRAMIGVQDHERRLASDKESTEVPSFTL